MSITSAGRGQGRSRSGIKRAAGAGNSTTKASTKLGSVASRPVWPKAGSTRANIASERVDELDREEAGLLG